MRTCAVEHLPCPFLPSVYLLWRKVYLDIDLLSICLIFFFFFFASLILKYMSCLCTLEINPLSVVSFTNTFSHCVGCLFVYGFLCCAKAFELN